MEELKGKNILDLTPEDMKITVSEQFRKLWKGEIHELDSFTWRVNGEEIPVDIHAGRIVYEGKDAIILTLRKRNR
jgi:PAS domain S-box-containing protein